MIIIKLTIVAGMLLALAGCVFPFGKSTGPDDDRSPYFSNDSNREAAPNPSDQFQPGPADNLN